MVQVSHLLICVPKLLLFDHSSDSATKSLTEFENCLLHLPVSEKNSKCRLFKLCGICICYIFIYCIKNKHTFLQ